MSKLSQHILDILDNRIRIAELSAEDSKPESESRKTAILARNELVSVKRAIERVIEQHPGQ